MSATAQAVLIITGAYLLVTLIACELERHLRRCAADAIGGDEHSPAGCRAQSTPGQGADGLVTADTFPTEWVPR